MNLLYDLSAVQPAENFKYHGGGEHARLIFMGLISSLPKGITLYAFYNEKNWIDPGILEAAKKKKVLLLTIKEKKDVEEIIRRHRIGRFFSALPYSFHDLDMGEAEFYCSMLGLRRMEMPTDRYEIIYANTWRERAEYIYKQIFTGRIIEKRKKRFERLMRHPRMTRIFANSCHTKYSLLANFSFLSGSDIEVFYPPRTAGVKPSSRAILNQLGLERKKYFVLVNSNRWLKNSFRALLAFDRLFSLFPGIEHKALFLGLDDGRIIRRFEKRIKNRGRFVFRGYVERDELERLYMEAFCFVYPSLNEGFGYPPLDCMKYGTPVLASAITSIPEVCGEGAMYFIPTSVDEIMNRLLQVAESEETRKNLSEKGMKACRSMMKKQDMMLKRLVGELVRK